MRGVGRRLREIRIQLQAAQPERGAALPVGRRVFEHIGQSVSGGVGVSAVGQALGQGERNGVVVGRSLQ